jgi:uncharacterized protein (TIGR03083 family)
VDDLTPLARNERQDLLELLDQLTPEEWAHHTLCAGWTVRDLVLHMFSFEDLSTMDLARRFVRGRLSVDRINAICLTEMGALATSDAAVLDLVRRDLEPRGLTAGFRGAIALTDGMIHHQDIRRPLRLPRVIPPDRLRPALDFAKYAPTIRGFWYRRGLRMIATDLDWAVGRGPEVRGLGEAILLALAGRDDVAGELTGPGQPRLARRLATASGH